MRLDSTHTAVVDRSRHWHPMTTCPRGVKVLLLGDGGVATLGTYDGKSTFWQGWAPLPTRREARMTSNDHRAALFDALRQCEITWAASQTHPSAEAGPMHDKARERFDAAVDALILELEKAHDHIARLNLDLHVLDKRVEAVGAGGVPLMGEPR